MIKEQYNIFMHALCFFTRVPPYKMIYKEEHEGELLRYFTLIGLFIGLTHSLFLFLFSLFLSWKIAVLLSLGFSLLITGAVHEDGLADTFDAFWGGMNIEKREVILKDSRLGVFGVLSLIIVVLLKIEVLILLGDDVLRFIIVGHVVSRFYSISPLLFFSYGGSKPSKSKTAANLSWKNFVVNGLVFVVILLWALSFREWLLSLILLPLLFFLCHLIKKKMGYFRGDFFGMIQQITEVSFYILMGFELR